MDHPVALRWLFELASLFAGDTKTLLVLNRGI